MIVCAPFPSDRLLPTTQKMVSMGDAYTVEWELGATGTPTYPCEEVACDTADLLIAGRQVFSTCGSIMSPGSIDVQVVSAGFLWNDGSHGWTHL